LVFFPDTVTVYICFVCSETCPAREVSCGPNATRSCIDERYLCDGDNDCGDDSDEEDCGELTTTKNCNNNNNNNNNNKKYVLWNAGICPIPEIESFYSFIRWG